MSKPQVNVTPLIDILLVLLIIFMVVTPLKPSAFKARVPADERVQPPNSHTNINTLAVIIGKDLSLALNNETGLGTVDETASLTARLRMVFEDRIANGNVSDSFADSPDRPYNDRIERTVFVKAPKDLDYGSVVRVVDAVKLAGAFPLSLQIDRLD